MATTKCRAIEPTLTLGMDPKSIHRCGQPVDVEGRYCSEHARIEREAVERLNERCRMARKAGT